MSGKITTNADLINDLMSYSPYGAMSQLFIIDALTKLSSLVVNQADELRESHGDDLAFDAEAWIGVAQDIKQRMDDFYGRDE